MTLFVPPKSFRKEMDNILLYLYVNFRVVFVVYVVLYLKFGPKNIDFYCYSYNVGERTVHRAVQRAVLPPHPLSHQELVIDAI